jgi:hypothetical protein
MTQPRRAYGGVSASAAKVVRLPLQLFLAANALVFAIQSLTGAKIFSTLLDQHLQNDSK